MNVTGIIAEYNPLHAGHRHHLAQARRETDADYLVVVMSGDYVQRGEPAVAGKHVRARMALLAGADLVLELPFPYAFAAAGEFAASGAEVLHRLGVVTALSFGSESGDIRALKRAADLLAQEPEAYRLALRDGLAEGLTFPAARQRALEASGEANGGTSLLASPNNILGAEYIRALNQLDSPILPHTIPRSGEGYHSGTVREGAFASATAIRQLLKNGDSAALAGQIPEECLPLLAQEPLLFPEDFSQILNYAVLSRLPQGYSCIQGFSRELSDRLADLAAAGGSWQERILQLKTKNYTYTRVSRALLCLVLGICREDVLAWKENCGFAPCARILGFKRTAAPLLSAIKKRGDIPLISKAADAGSLLSPKAADLFRRGMLASQIRSSVLAGKYNLAPANEYRRQIQIL